MSTAHFRKIHHSNLLTHLVSFNFTVVSYQASKLTSISHFSGLVRNQPVVAHILLCNGFAENKFFSVEQHYTMGMGDKPFL